MLFLMRITSGVDWGVTLMYLRKRKMVFSLDYAITGQGRVSYFISSPSPWWLSHFKRICYLLIEGWHLEKRLPFAKQSNNVYWKQYMLFTVYLIISLHNSCLGSNIPRYEKHFTGKYSKYRFYLFGWKLFD